MDWPSFQNVSYDRIRAMKLVKELGKQYPILGTSIQTQHCPVQQDSFNLGTSRDHGIQLFFKPLVIQTAFEHSNSAHLMANLVWKWLCGGRSGGVNQFALWRILHQVINNITFHDRLPRNGSQLWMYRGNCLGGVKSVSLPSVDDRNNYAVTQANE